MEKQAGQKQFGEDSRRFEDEEIWKDASLPDLEISNFVDLEIWNLVNGGWENMNEDDRFDLASREFSQIAVQLLLIIYQLEILPLRAVPRRLRSIEYERDYLKNTLVLSCIQKRNAWEEFDRFFTWWHKEVASRTPNPMLLGLLAMHVTLLRTLN